MTTVDAKKKIKAKPLLYRQYCKACSRCIDCCPKNCIEEGTEIEPATGFTPVMIDLETCNGCGLCISACPEPYALLPLEPEAEGPENPAVLAGTRTTPLPEPQEIPATRIPMPDLEPMVLKGNHAAAVGAILAGCRHVFGYPITPSTEGAELMARLLPDLHGVFFQAVSETATVNMMYGCGGAGVPCMTFTSSPGFSLMLEGVSYMIGAEVPGVFVNVMRGGPGLGNIAPEQGDIKLVCRGLGHGNTHALVLAPSTPQEMLDLTIDAFELTFKYRNPVILAGDGYLGQMTSRVTLPKEIVKPGVPAWAVNGDAEHRGNLISSFYLQEAILEQRNIMLNEKYAEITENEQRAESFFGEDAEWLVVACNTPARMAKGAVQVLRDRGIKAGLFRPISLWPFPIKHLVPLLDGVRGFVVVEAGAGQLEDEMRLALSHANVHAPPPIDSVQHYGGVLPQQQEIVHKVTALAEGSSE
jgi:pyruvate/2-oxoacid:ferredoxin oxidoreductase alpha subunit/NAD-dependent dihydropyrimidine dehydrogenase PreA subunit